MTRWLSDSTLRRAAAALGLFLLVVAAALFFFPEPIKETVCQKGDSGGAGHCATYGLITFLWVEVWHVLNDYSPAITALGTACIAWFTVTLARVGRNQHEAATRSNVISRRATSAARASADAAVMQARAAIGVELPKMLLTSIKLTNSAVSDLRATLQYPLIQIVMTNFGRTPAFLRQESIGMTVGQLPPYPGKGNAIDVAAETVIDQGRPYILQRGSLGGLVSPDQIELLLKGMPIWIYGYVYYRDFLGDPHMARFLKQMSVANAPGKLPWIVFTDWDDPDYTRSF